MKEVARYRRCFVCGEENIHGLKAKFLFDGKEAFTDIVATEAFEGYHGIFHGGIVATLLDEVMIKAILARSVYAVTAELTIRFKKPIRIGDKVRFTGRILNQKSRLYSTEGEASGPDGQIYATASGSYIEARPELKRDLLDSIDQS